MSDPRLAVAIAHHRAGRTAEADRLYRDILDAAPDDTDALNLLGVLAHQRGDHETAAELIERAIERRPDIADFHNNLGEALRALGRIDDAARRYQAAIDRDPGHAHAHHNLGLIALHERRIEAALHHFERAILLKPDSAPFHDTFGRARLAAGDLAGAAAAFREAASRAPEDAGVWQRLGLTLQRQRRLDAAIDCYRRALAIDPDLSEVDNNLGVALVERGEPAGALAHYRAALARNSDSATLHHNLARALRKLGRLDEANDHFSRVLTLDPRHVEGLNGLGDLRIEQGRVSDALALYERALDTDPDPALVNLVARANLICDWARLARYLPRLPDRVKRIETTAEGADSLVPLTFTLPYLSRDNDLIRAISFRVGDHFARTVPRLRRPPRNSARARLRIAYMSPDFGDHPIGHVTRPIYALHDRARFEITCYATLDRSAAGGAYLDSIRQGCDRFVDLSKLSHADCARRIAADGIDILVDLAGYMRHSRPEVLAMKPAPLQVYWQGHTGSLGAPYIDYVIGDAVVMPATEAERYAERIVRLPDSFSSADRAPISDAPQRRADYRLPERAPVFCGFNNPLKIEPEVFDSWMRILRAVPRAVLWLSRASDPKVEENLAAEARARGVDPARLLFADRIADKAVHLARHSLADLFLDTFKFNASTTALDALWAGLPVLARRGDNAYSRLSSSYLLALRLPELVCDSTAAYERRAVELISDPTALDHLKAKLHANRLTTPLFDAERFVRHLERAYRMMWDRHAAGRAPRALDVPALD